MVCGGCKRHVPHGYPNPDSFPVALQTPPLSRRDRLGHARTRQSHSARAMAASLRSPAAAPAAFRRSSASSSPPPSSFASRRSESVTVQQLARPLGNTALPIGPYFMVAFLLAEKGRLRYLTPAAEYVSLPATHYSVHIPLHPWRGEGSSDRRRHVGRRASGGAAEPSSPPDAAPSGEQQTSASAGKAVVPDDEFSLAKVREAPAISAS